MTIASHTNGFSLYGQRNNLLNAYMAQKDNAIITAMDTDKGTNSNKSEDQKQPSHEELIDAIAREHDKEAFITLFEYFAPRVKSFLMRGGTAPDLADELAQETMLSVWQKARSFDSARARASTWIFTIARNKRIDAFRKTRLPVADLGHFEMPDSKAAMPDIALDNIAQADTLATAIKGLPEEQATLIRKSFFEDKTHSAIAGEENIPLGTVKSRIRLALDKLRHHLGEVEL